jgi:aryl-alcohol dehydrogenase-like predicted oxidoreductase
MTTTMTTRTLGRGGIEVSALGLGCWAIGGPFWNSDGIPAGWGEVDDTESTRAVRRALDLGVRFFDTADVYGTGHSEEVLGAALAGHRDEVVIATKWGNTFDPAARRLTGPDPSPKYLRSALEGSLRRLGTDRIDVYQLHPQPAAAEALDLVAELDALVDEGLIRAYGWSIDDPERIRAFAAGSAASVVQHEMNVLRDEPAVLAACDTYDLASVVRGPLAMGLLSGRYAAGATMPRDDVRGQGLEWMRYFRDGRPAPDQLARLDAVRDVLTSDGRTLVQGALAWIWARSPRTVPIPGFRTVAQVEENAGALANGPLTPAQFAEVERLLDRASGGA